MHRKGSEGDSSGLVEHDLVITDACIASLQESVSMNGTNLSNLQAGDRGR